MENGNLPRKKSKKKKIRSNSPQTSNGSEKYFCGFSGRSVRNICEQIDNTEIQPEVYSQVAEDATYKVMELVNSIKNYAKHSGGKVTFDLTNEVLKDANCAPILGSDTNKTYAAVEDDHKQMIYFSEDGKLNLTDEFHKHITEENVNGPVFLTNTYLLDEKIDEDYIEFYQSICDAIFTGDDECKSEALIILGTSSHVAGLVKHFLIKWIDMIAVNYSQNILERSIEYLEAILRNPYTINSDMNIELKHVCQLLVSLLVGSINDEVRENGHYAELEQEVSEYATYDTNNIVSYDGNNGLLDNNNGINLDDMSSDSNMKFDENNAMLIENFSMESEKTGRTLKDELLEGFEDFNKVKLENQEDASKDSGSLNSGRNHDIEDEFNALLSTNCASTTKCSEEYVESICKLIGMCGSKWYGVENYLTILITNEIENFIKLYKRFRTDGDFEWLGRISKGLWSLGEFPFRELLQYFEKIEAKNYLELPKFACDINVAAMYLRGKNDIFFYEFLQEICGDKLMPFLVYYAQFLLSANKQKHAAIVGDKERGSLIFKISTKKRLIGYRIQRLHPISEARPPLARIISQQPKTINIHYGHKVSTKKLKRSFKANDEKREVRQNAENLRSFHQRVVIVKGRYFKPVTNQRQISYYPNLHTLNL